MLSPLQEGDTQRRASSLTIVRRNQSLRGRKSEAIVAVGLTARRTASGVVGESNRMGKGLLRLAVLIVGALAVIGTARGETGGDDVKCEALGFTGLALCSDCDSLAEYVKDQELESDCRKCCAKESEDFISKTTYAGAILEVCLRKLAYYPNIQSIVEGKLSEFPSVEVQYRYGSPPKLIMMDRDGNHKETIRIDNWKSEHIEQFLKEKVRP